MYRVEFWFFAAANGCGVFRREADLPFAPAAGLRVCFCEHDAGGHEVRGAAWLAGEGKFVCRLDDDASPGGDWGALRDHYASRGWSLEAEAPATGGAAGPGRGADPPAWLGDCRGEG